MSEAQLDLVECLMSRQNSKNASARAARDVLVHGLSRPSSQAKHGVSRAALAKAIRIRQEILSIALNLALLSQKERSKHHEV